MEYIKTLAKRFNSEIINERGEIYTVDNIDKFDYESDILFGINSISLKINDREIDKYIIFGINRVVSFDGKMIEKIYGSSNAIDTFSNMVKEIQYLDAYSAHQNFYKNNDDGKIMGGYALTQGVRTILPYEPSVEFENSDILKNDDISFWNIGLVIIDGDENDKKNYYGVGNLNYNDFIKKLPKNKYKFIDASYIMVEPLSKEEILELVK